MKSQRILHVVGGMDAGGIEIMLMVLLRKLQHTEMKSDLCVFNEKVGLFEPEVISLGCGIKRCILSKNVLSFAWKLYRLLRKEKYDIVDSNVLLFSGVCLSIARLAGVPKRVAHLHNSRDGKKSSLWRRICRRLLVASIKLNATHIVGVTGSALEAWLGKEWHHNSKISIRYDGLDLAPFECQRDSVWLKTEFDVSENFKTVIHVGRFEPQKNHIKLVQIANSYITEIDDNVCFICIGDGSLKKEIEEVVRRKGLEKYFRFAGVRTDVPRIMKAADAFLFPTAWEGFGVVVVEAIAACLPMVVTDLPAIQEIINICNVGNAMPLDAKDRAWAEKLKKAIDMPNDESWFERVSLSPFTVDMAVQTLLNIYRAQ